MNAQRYSRVRQLFHEISELPPAERTARLDRACAEDPELGAEVRSLLAHHESDSSALGDDAAGIGLQLLAQSTTGAIPRQIGHYRILRKIGEGGMGTVFEAEQDNPRRRVALKVIRPSLATTSLLRRFEREASLLGQLQHAGIAHIYEAGAADMDFGRQPYFAMELIRGKALTDYARDHHLGMRQRLALLAKVCHAVQHAHEHGVIHRDLKPGNILVDETGQPKILDFGVARATDCDVHAATLRTDVGQVVGTLPYMSPEQVAGDSGAIDARSDVYALGVIAFELLSGRFPIAVADRPLAEAARVIREDDPSRLSDINPILRGDVDTMVAKALEKPPQRRYPSAGAFAADIERYLADQPIVARPASTLYTLQKFARRNRGLVGGLAATALALIAGTVGMAWLAIREHEQRGIAESARDQARIEAGKARAINDFLVKDLLGAADPKAGATVDLTLREVVSGAAAKAEKAFAEQPAIRAAVQYQLGDIFYNLGDYDVAEDLLAKSCEGYRSIEGMDSPSAWEAYTQLAHVLWRAGKLDKAEDILQEAASHYRQADPIDPERLGNTVNALANVMYFRGKYAESEPVYREALEWLRQAYPGDHEDVAAVLGNLANVAFSTNRFDAAVGRERESMDMWRRVRGDDHIDTAMAYNNLAVFLVGVSSYEEAETYFQKALEIRTRAYGDKHPDIAETLGRMADLYGRTGRVPQAKECFQRSIAMRRTLLGDDHIEVGQIYHQYATFLMNQNDLPAAEEARRAQVDVFTRAFGINGRRTVIARGHLALIFIMAGKYAEAETLLSELLKVPVDVFAPGDYFPGYLNALMGLTLGHLKRDAEAEPLLLTGYEHVRTSLGAETAHARKIAQYLADYYAERGQSEISREWAARAAKTPKP